MLMGREGWGRWNGRVMDISTEKACCGRRNEVICTEDVMRT
jgi:hypothetical protein